MLTDLETMQNWGEPLGGTDFVAGSTEGLGLDMARLRYNAARRVASAYLWIEGV